MGVIVGDAFSYHLGNDFVNPASFHFQGADLFPIPQHGHTVTDLFDFLHPVGDIDDRNPLFLQHPDDFKQLTYLVLRQGGRGLVHNKDAAVG